jgi:hypothetical protein
MAGRSRRSKGTRKGWETRRARAAAVGMRSFDYVKRSRGGVAGSGAERATAASAYVESASAAPVAARALPQAALDYGDALFAGVPLSRVMRILAEVAEVLKRNGVKF